MRNLIKAFSFVMVVTEAASKSSDCGDHYYDSAADQSAKIISCVPIVVGTLAMGLAMYAWKKFDNSRCDKGLLTGSICTGGLLMGCGLESLQSEFQHRLSYCSS